MIRKKSHSWSLTLTRDKSADGCRAGTSGRRQIGSFTSGQPSDRYPPNLNGGHPDFISHLRLRTSHPIPDSWRHIIFPATRHTGQVDRPHFASLPSFSSVKISHVVVRTSPFLLTPDSPNFPHSDRHFPLIFLSISAIF